MCREKGVSGGETEATEWRAQEAGRQPDSGGAAGGSGRGRSCGDE